MKYLLMLSTLTASLMFSAASWAEWTEAAESADTGIKTYVDFDRIRKVNGLVYYWDLDDLLEPSSNGYLSYKSYHKADCETMRRMALSMSLYKLPMAEGTAELTFTPDPAWTYAPPDSVGEAILEAVCAH